MAVLTGQIYKGISLTLRFHNVAVGRIDGVAALQGVSYKKNVWAFRRDKIKWP